MSDSEEYSTIKKTEEGEVPGKNTDNTESRVAENVGEEEAIQKTDNTENGATKKCKEAEVPNAIDSTKCTIQKTQMNTPDKITPDTGNAKYKTEEVEDGTLKKTKKRKNLQKAIDSVENETIEQAAGGVVETVVGSTENRATTETEVFEKICEVTENGTIRRIGKGAVKKTKNQVVVEKNGDNNGSTTKSEVKETDTVKNDTIKESEEVKIFTRITDKNLPLSFIQKRHTDAIEGVNELLDAWRVKEEIKTVCIALVLCLKFDIIPYDIIKTKPCAKLECWGGVSPKQAITQIGSRLEKQYERLQFKSIKFDKETVYQKVGCYQCLDPNVEEIKEMCLSFRKRSIGDRILFHYNGHGVLKPSELGEIYFFNKDFSSYMPISLWDLIIWLSPPIVFVFDCAEAEKVVNTFELYRKQHEHLFENDLRNSIIHLAACKIKEVLPINPNLPADVFTSCLTTPVKMAMYWHTVVQKCRLAPKVDFNLIERLPGKLNDRQTMLGELYWIFTAITDAIAWDVVPRDLFHKLYRQDEILASLFRNYLLAERIMKAHDCTPVTYPKLPCTFKHPLWKTWDFVIEESLYQLQDVVHSKKPYEHSTFFTDQLTAFEKWLWLGSKEKPPPEQLPILLQVLLNKTYRMRALKLLVKFLDLGPWAVNLALSVGIFPYMLQLLNQKTKELQKLLVFIWAKILAVDISCQVDLILANDCKYFVSILKDHTLDDMHRTLAAFVLASVVNNFAGQRFFDLGNSLITICLEELSHNNAQLKQWIAICLARVWDKYSNARWTGVRDNAHVKLYPLLQDPCPEVRAAAVYALGTYIHSVNNVSEHADKINQTIAITLVDTTCHDMSPLVRQELVAALQWIILTYRYKFIQMAAQESSTTRPLMHKLKRCGSSSLPVTDQDVNTDLIGSPQHLRRTASISSINSAGSPSSPRIRYSPFNIKTWAALCILEVDAHPKVAQTSAVVTSFIRSQINKPIDVQRRVNIKTSSSSNKAGRSQSEIHKPIVTTQFVPWACKLIALPLLKTNKQENDPESQLNYEREWRLQRNTNVRAKARENYSHARNCTSYSQVYSSHCGGPPTVLQFHPYDQLIAIASQRSFAIWDWDRKCALIRFSTKSYSKSNKIKKITALEWINAHDVALLMSASNEGNVELWRPIFSSNEYLLVSAWRAHKELTKLIPSNVFLSWEQWTQTIIASGSACVIRLWDVEQELHAFDIPTGSKHPATCIDSVYAGTDYKNMNCMVLKSTEDNLQQFANQKHGLIATGFADGSIRLYDRRCRPRDAQVMNLVDHMSSILTVQLRGDNIVSGCNNGYVRIYDIRSKAAINTYHVPHMENLSALSIHRNADIYAWGSTDRHISLYNMLGDNLNVICFQEHSIFSSRIGPVTCLAFHPHNVMFAAGSSDCSVAFYSMAPRK